MDILQENADSREWGDTSEHFKALVAAFQENQWAATDFDGGVMCSTVGTSAGVPLAGLVAATALSKVTRRIQSRLVAEGLVTEVPWQGRKDKGKCKDGVW